MAPFEIRLSPAGVLYLDCTSKAESSATLAILQQRFTRDWREGWFCLAADRIACEKHCSLHFWQEIAKDYLTALCHLPEEEEFSPIQTPGIDCLNSWLLKAPPMVGGEYLSQTRLSALWEQLNGWVEEAASKSGGIHPFLQKRAPKWQQVGRVCFHLVENSKDRDRPFAFLATFSTGFGASGQLKHLPLQKAFNQYAGERNQQALIKLLTPVQRAAEACPWVSDLLNTGELYQPLAWSASKAYRLLATVPKLEESGLSVRIPDWWKRRSRPQVTVTIGTQADSKLSVGALLDFNVELALGDQKLSEEELHKLCSTNDGIAYLRGQWVELDSTKLKQALDHWKRVQQQANRGGISFIEGMRLLAGMPTSLEKEQTVADQRSWVNVAAGDALANVLKQLKDPSSLPREATLKKVNASLRPYQEEGINWLCLLSGLGLGACLADDMGLGKTLQILSLLLIEQQRSQGDQHPPSLLVVPASLLGNWKRESTRFTPSLKLLLAHPSETKQQLLAKLAAAPAKQLKNIDLVVTTYSMIIRQKWIAETNWNLLILDEAQAIKNAGTKQSRAIRGLKSRSRIALTGTPIENRLSDLWSLFDFLNPGLLGSSSRFQAYIREMQAANASFESLRKLVSPYILRRMKTDPKILSDLPEKIETPVYCQLTKEQIRHYQATVEDLKKKLENTDSQQRRGIVLQTLLRFKQICNHPNQLTGYGDYHPSMSGKFLRLEQICEELASRQEKVLLFTQFREIIDPLAEHLTTIFGRGGLTLHGGTPIKLRKELVAEFQKETGPPFFILSLKAGGTGLTLTAASHVIHFDRWWNPAVENQATDRAFRIGQKKNVQVHTFITQGTIEEEIDKIITSKKHLAGEVLDGGQEIKITELPDEELLDLVALNIDKATIN